MRNRLLNLIDVKSIITIIMTFVFCIMSVIQVISSQQFMTVFATVIAFYFGTQQKKSPVELQNETSKRSDKNGL